jgi:hypothetical protein
MRQSTSFLAAAVLAAAWLFPAPAARAQDQSPSPPASPHLSNPSAITDAKLDAAAAALQSVANVRQNYEQRIAQAPAEEKSRLADEGNAALAKAVTDQGLSVEEYAVILQVAQVDSAVRDKILQRIRPPAN